MISFTQLLAAVAVTSPALVDAYWRMECGTVQTGRIDPIVSPDTISSHVHKISGGSNININSTYESMRDSTCTSCEIGADKSGYWTPQLYFEHANGTFEEVPNGGTVVYYLGRGVNIDNAVPFPPGFQMLSGTPFARSYDNETMTWGNSTYPPRPVSDRVSFVCIPDYSQPALPQLTWMDFDTWGGNQMCENGMRAQIQFPSCWDGENLYKPDGSHVAYLSQIDNGACPPTHPVQFIHLFFEVYYTVAMPQFDMTSGGRFVFAYGDPTGFGFHGDFLNGWDIDVLTTAIDECAVGNQFGTIDTCAPLAASDTNTYGQNCPIYAPTGIPLINETVLGVIGDKLPGCITIVDGPEDATLDDMTCGPNVPNPTIESFAEQTPIVYAEPVQNEPFGLSGWNYVDCFEDGVNGTRTLNAASTTSSNMTVEYCQSYCFGQGWRYAGVEYGSQCFCDSQMPAGVPGNQTGCTQQCAGNSTELCGGPNRISVFNNTISTATIAAPGAGATPVSAGIYVGCASEGTGGRALSGASIHAPNMTIEYCRSYCSAQGFVLSGVEYSDECYCGNSFTNGGALLADNSTCNMLCAGNGMETCGGPNRLSVFSIPVNASATCPISDGTTLTVGSSQYILNCNTDLAGGDLSMVYTDSIYDCASACANTTNCVASSWIPGSPNGPCYMKGAIGAASASTRVWSIKQLTQTVTHACPGNNGANITVGSSSYTLQCSTDHINGDLSSVSAVTVDACAAACANTTSCVGASYVPGYPGTCYMKSQLGAGSSNSGVWALVPASPAVVSSTSSSSTSTSSTMASTSSSISTTSMVVSTSSSSAMFTNTSSSTSAITSGSSTSSANTTSTSSPAISSSTFSATAANLRAAATANTAAQAVGVASSTSSSMTFSSTSSNSASSSSTTFATTSGASSTSASTSSSTSSSSSALTTSSSIPTTSSTSFTTSTTSSTTTTSSSATSTPTILCPAANLTTYSVLNTTTLVNTTFQIQCGLDHPGNAAMVYTNSMYGCLQACANYANCTDVSLSGRACYMKTTLKTAGAVNPSIWGAVVLSQTTVGSGSGNGSAMATPIPTTAATSVMRRRGMRGMVGLERSW